MRKTSTVPERLTDDEAREISIVARNMADKLNDVLKGHPTSPETDIMALIITLSINLGYYYPKQPDLDEALDIVCTNIRHMATKSLEYINTKTKQQ